MKLQKGFTPWNKNTKGLVKPNKGSFKKGHTPWNKDKHGIYSTETIEKMAESKRGKSAWNKNLSPSAETREKIRVANQGKKYSRTTCEKHSRDSIKMWQNPEIREKIIKALKGKVRTEEVIKRCLRRRIPSSLEKKFQKIVDKFGLPYKFTGDGSFILGRCNPDFVNVNGEKIAIEVYARYYKERNGRNILRWKHVRRQKFAKFGWEILFFDETQVREEYVVSKLEGKIMGS